MAKAALAATVAWSSVSCSAPPRAPVGYLPLEAPGTVLTAVAANGCRYEVRIHPNPEGGTLGFWSDAIENQLVEAKGYQRVSRAVIESANGTRGTELLFSVRHSLEVYDYWLAVFVDGDEIVLAEAGGRQELFAPDLEAVRAAVATLRW